MKIQICKRHLLITVILESFESFFLTNGYNCRNLGRGS